MKKKRLTPEKIQKMKNKKMHDPKEKKKWTFVDIKKHPNIFHYFAGDIIFLEFIASP